MFRTSNPALRNDAFRPAQTWDDVDSSGRGVRGVDFGSRSAAASTVAVPGAMTVQGTVNKSFFLLALVVVSALVTWRLFDQQSPWATGLFFGGAIGGFISCLVACFVPRSAPITAPLYSLAQGLVVGGISYFYAARFGGQNLHVKGSDVTLNAGLILNAVLLTFGITGATLSAYAFKIIRPGRMFYNVTLVAMLGLLGYGLIAWIAAAFFHAPTMASVYNPSNGGTISLLFSGFVLVLGAANLVLDFDTISQGVRNRAPKSMEWYGAFALMVTLIWIYFESLRMLAKLQSRRN